MNLENIFYLRENFLIFSLFFLIYFYSLLGIKVFEVIESTTLGSSTASWTITGTMDELNKCRIESHTSMWRQLFSICGLSFANQWWSVEHAGIRVGEVSDGVNVDVGTYFIPPRHSLQAVILGLVGVSQRLPHGVSCNAMAPFECILYNLRHKIYILYVHKYFILWNLESQDIILIQY